VRPEDRDREGDCQTRCGEVPHSEAVFTVEEEALKQHRRQQGGSNGKLCLGEQVRNVGADRRCQQRQQRTETIVTPIVRSPLLDADEAGKQRIGVVLLVNPAEIYADSCGGNDAKQNAPDCLVRHLSDCNGEWRCVQENGKAIDTVCQDRLSAPCATMQ
jgi:hypothetical protein